MKQQNSKVSDVVSSFYEVVLDVEVKREE